MSIKRMTDLDLQGKKVLIRQDLNVPVKDGKVTSDIRIKASLPTIEKALTAGAAVIVMSHLGRPVEGEFDEAFSLAPVAEHMSNLLNKPVRLEKDWLDGVAIEPGEIVLCENVRFNVGEKKNDAALGRKMAALCDIFVMDAFGTAHRAHASNVGVTKHFSHKGMGFLIEKELQYLSEAMIKPDRPLTVILGGAKIDTKLNLIRHFAGMADYILIGGGMAFTFLQAQGKDIGNSLVDRSMLATAKAIMSRARGKTKLIFPTDFVCAASMDNSQQAEIYKVGEIPDKLDRKSVV